MNQGTCLPNLIEGRIAGPSIQELLNRNVVEGSSPNRINAASVDLILGNYFYVERRPSLLRRIGMALGIIQPKVTTLTRDDKSTPHLTHGPDMDLVTGEVILRPGDRCLAETVEKFNLPSDISAEVRLRSTAARRGLNHAFASWCDAGWHGSVLTLEFQNTNKWHSIKLRAGDSAVQMIFDHHLDSQKFSYAAKGTYNNSTTVETGK